MKGDFLNNLQEDDSFIRFLFSINVFPEILRKESFFEDLMNFIKSILSSLLDRILKKKELRFGDRRQGGSLKLFGDVRDR